MGKKRKKQKKRQQQKFQNLFSDLIIAVDWSKGKKTMFGLVGTSQEKLPKLTSNAPWLKHISESRNRRERRAYVEAFPKRFQRIRQDLNLVKITPKWQVSKTIIKEQNPKTLIVDDTIYYKYKVACELKTNIILESQAKKKPHLRTLSLIADNIAYIAREEYEHSKTLEEVKRRLRKRGIL